MPAADRALLAALGTLPDPRGAPGTRRPVPAMLTLACGAMCGGQQTSSAIADWGRTYAASHPGWAAARGFTREDRPGAATFVLLFRALDRQAFEAIVGQWAEAVLAAHPPRAGTLAVIALAGKTLRGSAKHGVPAAQLLSAFSQRRGVTRGQRPGDDKPNEMPGAPEWMSALVLTGRVLTMDALLTHRESAQARGAGGGDYVMVVKDNPPRLHQDIATVFASPPPRPITRGGRRRRSTAATAAPSGD